MPDTPIIPETVTVHLGAPDANVANVTLSFADYIKNVASSEVYPKWPDAAIRANVLAQISYTLNRIYTEYYPSRGYAFDITNDISRDQSFVYGRDIFDNISRIVDETFNSYLRSSGSVEPLFAAYCDGIEVQCQGLSQWGSVDLAEDGYTPIEILRYYYGDNIELVQNVPVAGVTSSVPTIPLRLGSIGPEVEQVQRRLNRISTNYPAIPKIYPVDGVFDAETDEAVKAFQQAFNLTPDGIVGQATWYRIQAIYAGVKRLSNLNSEGISYADISTQYVDLSEGSTGIGVQVIQYFLNYIANNVGTVSPVTIDGSFGPGTTAALRSFQRTYGLSETGILNRETYNTLYNVYYGLVQNLDLLYREGTVVPFPGLILLQGSEGEAVTLLQNYLNFIARTYPEIQTVPVTGYFGTQTAEAVGAFQDIFNLPGERGVVNAAIWNSLTSVYEDLYIGNTASEGQYPGYAVGGDNT